MGYIYVIQNIIENKYYVGQTTRDIKIRWTEHRNNKNRLLSQSIKEYGHNNFKFIETIEIKNEDLDNMEIEYIKKYDCVSPNGYNIKQTINTNLNHYTSSKGGLSEIGHDKQSLKAKEKYKNNPKLKDLGDVPRGISYCHGVRRGYHNEGFKVRKKGVPYKEFVSRVYKNNLSENLQKAKMFLSQYEEKNTNNVSSI